jgi:hypothetical protein
VRLVGTIKGGELNRVSHKEDGLVIKDPILVALGGLELDSPSTEIADGVGGASCWPYGRYASEKLCAFTNTSEEIGISEIGEVMGDLEVAMGTGSFGVDDPFGNPFTREMSKCFN